MGLIIHVRFLVLQRIFCFLIFNSWKRANFRNDGGYRPKETEEMQTVNSKSCLIRTECRSILPMHFWYHLKLYQRKDTRRDQYGDVSQSGNDFLSFSLWSFLCSWSLNSINPDAQDVNSLVWNSRYELSTLVWKEHVWLCSMQKDLFWECVAHINENVFYLKS